jgi:hypothetical protein
MNNTKIGIDKGHWQGEALMRPRVCGPIRQ